MKPNIPIFLTSLFCGLSHATVKIQDLPMTVQVGGDYPLIWSTDRDYQVTELALWRREGSSLHHVHDIGHTWGTYAPNHTDLFHVPKVRKYSGKASVSFEIWFAGRELMIGPDGKAATNGSFEATAVSNQFNIEGGVTLFPKEIAGIVVGSVAAVALLVCLFVFGARFIRKRRTVAVNLPGPEEGGYTDARQA